MREITIEEVRALLDRLNACSEAIEHLSSAETLREMFDRATQLDRQWLARQVNYMLPEGFRWCGCRSDCCFAVLYTSDSIYASTIRDLPPFEFDRLVEAVANYLEKEETAPRKSFVISASCLKAPLAQLRRTACASDEGAKDEE